MDLTLLSLSIKVFEFESEFSSQINKLSLNTNATRKFRQQAIKMHCLDKQKENWISLANPSNGHYPVTPNWTSLANPSNSHYPLTPNRISLANPSNSHYPVTPNRISLANPSNSHYPVTPNWTSLANPSNGNCPVTPNLSLIHISEPTRPP